MRNVLGIAAGISSLLMIVPLTAANAADLPVKALPPPVPICVWCGWYAGINLGGSWGDDPAVYSTTVPAIGAATLHPSGGVGGAQVGYNWVQGNGFVFGLEGDLDVRRNSATAIGVQAFPGFVTSVLDFTATDNWLSTGRARVGWATNNVLFYGSGGLAVGEVDHSYTQRLTINPAASLLTSDAVVRTGWAAGGGIDWMALRGVSFGIEYLHVDLGRSTTVQAVAITQGGVFFAPSSTSFSNRSDIVRAKVDFHFGG